MFTVEVKTKWRATKVWRQRVFYTECKNSVIIVSYMHNLQTALLETWKGAPRGCL